MRRGTKAALALAVTALALTVLAAGGAADSTEPRSPIFLNGDDDAHANTCQCIANPHADGTDDNPYIIEGWRIEHDEGIGIEIWNMDNVHIIVRDNSIETPNGIKLDDTGTRVDLYRNHVDYEDAYGIKLVDASPHAQGNVIRGWTGWCGCPSGTGIHAEGSQPVIRENVISTARHGIKAISATPLIVDNELFQNKFGIVLESSAKATIEGNLIRLSVDWGITVTSSSQADVQNNDVRRGEGGVKADSAHKLHLAGNTLTNMDGDAVRFDDTAVTMLNNEVSDNWRGAVGSDSSDLLIQGNTFSNNGDDAITLTETSGEVENNLLVKNEGTAIALEHSIMTMTDNELANNSYGFSIPYDSRQSIELMSGNIVNDINVDGTLDASEQRLFYKEVNVEVTGTLIDSGNGEGYYGVHTRQGALVLYDVTGATIESNTFANQTTPDPSLGVGRAIYLHNTFNADILDNRFTNNQEGLVAVDSRTFVKDNECDIDVDPPETLCFEAQGGYMEVEANTVLHVDIGIRFTVSAATGHAADGKILSNVVKATTQIGIALEGDYSSAPMTATATDNDVHQNPTGFRLTYMLGTLEANRITQSSQAAVEVTDRSDVTLEANQITHNANGILDVGGCSSDSTVTCSSASLTDNQIQDNEHVGVRLLDGLTLNGDAIEANEIGVHGYATVTIVNADITDNGQGIRTDGTLVLSGALVADNEHAIDAEGQVEITSSSVVNNDGPGLEADGDAELEEAILSQNGGPGAIVSGSLDATDTEASGNGEDGLRVKGTARLDTVHAAGNEGDGVSIRGEARLDEVRANYNEDAGVRLSGERFEIQACEAIENEHGILVEDGSVNLGQDLVDARLDPSHAFKGIRYSEVRISECDILDNAAFAVTAPQDVLVEAQLNFWGDHGPVYNTPFHRSPNTISNHVIVTPYWQDEDHTQPGFVPSFEIAPGLTPAFFNGLFVSP